MNAVRLTVNGRSVSIQVEPRTHLGDFLRDHLRQTGTHLGCEHGVCGACTVLVNDAPIRSCITFAVACESKDIRTIEGFEDDDLMSQLRDAFSREHALQCGFCTPGMLIAARDIVLRLPDADEARIRHELAGNICRCTGYLGIVRAVRSVIDQRRAAGTISRTTVASAVPADRAKEPLPRYSPAEPLMHSMAIVHTGGTSSSGSEPRQGWTRFDESFVISIAPAEVWEVLSDVPRMAACLPGAELLEHSERTVKGRMRVKVGPIQAAFVGSAAIDRDDVARVGKIRGAGSDAGSGSRTKAEVTYRVESDASGTGSRVSVVVEYNLQGPLAQFSRSGLVQELARYLVGEFAENLSAALKTPADARRQAAAPFNAGALVRKTLMARLAVFVRKLFAK